MNTKKLDDWRTCEFTLKDGFLFVRDGRYVRMATRLEKELLARVDELEKAIKRGIG